MPSSNIKMFSANMLFLFSFSEKFNKSQVNIASVPSKEPKSNIKEYLLLLSVHYKPNTTVKSSTTLAVFSLLHVKIYEFENSYHYSLKLHCAKIV